ncbi:hypothetical protein MKW98_004975 [Papaver atlanticum]|uniref:FBD domain-containing protein n=1 Tax=Papaver atlanticum TaxID=357466 RepID=A0AAD4XX23_9MAGN|nr:hypothetical protein MKW98_004975 [Papaver atlanticum]
MRNFCISIPTLKQLSISNWCGAEESYSRLHVLKIDAPRLVTFSCWSYVPKEIFLSSTLALVEATVHVSADEKGISRLLRALAHVKCLTVYDCTLQAIYSTYGLSNNLLKLHNVKMLKISRALTSDQGLIALLKAVPNLESLVFDGRIDDELEDSDKDDGDDDHDADSVQGDNNQDNEDEGDVSDTALCGSCNECGDDSWALDIVTTGCLLPHLKSVCFQHFVGNPRAMKWVRLILRDAKALQMMAIIYYDTHLCYVNVKSKKELMEEMPTFPRASPSCVIKFCCKD